MDLKAWLLLLEGAWTTVWISGIAIAIGISAGLLIAIIRRQAIPVIDQLLALYISLARATPLVTLVLFLFLSLPAVGINLDKHVAAFCEALGFDLQGRKLKCNAFWINILPEGGTHASHIHRIPRESSHFGIAHVRS